ncbi:uncharacterized protein TrAtP1_002733 [Trichoderma atroviride]|uniref:uncharacterized protein n=1 Tax=Hypocrea atroviridis TaxID=63577 RepID=UPI00332FC1F4|nr:hypothetical protein TrAtP1_002733 [Trichoderma atroviride]
MIARSRCTPHSHKAQSQSSLRPIHSPMAMIFLPNIAETAEARKGFQYPARGRLTSAQWALLVRIRSESWHTVSPAARTPLNAFLKSMMGECDNGRTERFNQENIRE